MAETTTASIANIHTTKDAAPSTQEPLATSSTTVPETVQQNDVSSQRSSPTPGRPSEHLQVEEQNEDNIQYPTGPQLWLNMIAVLLVCFLHGLDLTIVAVTVPSLTNQFKTLNDIGWYSAVYGLIFSATNFFFGKMYTLFGLKQMYIASVVIFELGSLLCTLAPSSKMFIFGRAVAGQLSSESFLRKLM